MDMTSENLPGCLLFLHLPKAAGTTLSSVIWRQYSKEQAYTKWGSPTVWEERLRDWSRRERASLRFIGGHFRYGLHKQLPQSAEYISVMRDPIERIISQYYFIRRDADHTLHNWVHEKPSSVKEYVERRLNSPHWTGVKNQQARRLAGLEEAKEREPKRLVETAKENIRRDFSVVGTTERFDESLLLMQEVYGWGHVFYRKRKKTGSRPTADDLDAQTRGKIEEVTPADRALYDWVSDRLDQQLDGRVSTEDVARFQRRNRIYSTYRRVRSGIARAYRRVFGN